VKALRRSALRRELSQQVATALDGKPQPGLIAVEWKRSTQRVGLTILTGQTGTHNIELAGPSDDDSVSPPTEPTPARTSQPATPAANDPLDQIRRLAELRDQGIITEQEFAAKKAELLDRI
jgi:hypothetical protein